MVRNQSEAYGKLMELSRMSSSASPEERYSLAQNFDKALAVFSPESSTGGGTWTTFNSVGGGYNPQINETSALTISTYYACIRVIAEDCAKLPLNFFTEERIENRPTRTPFNDEMTYLLSVSPNERTTAFDFWKTMISWAAGIGGAFAKIDFNGFGDPIAYNQIHPTRIQIMRDGKNNRMWFKIYNNDGSYQAVNENEMFYFFGTSPDGYVGYSVIQLMQNTLTRSNAADRYARHFFTNNGRPNGILTTDEVLSPQSREALKSQWQDAYAGPMNAGKTAVVDSGLKYQALSGSFKDMEFIGQRAIDRAQICEWFRVNPRKVGVETNAKGWASIDAEEMDHYNSCLMPWIVNIEQRIRKGMPRWKYPDNIKCEFDASYILRGDIKTRQELNTARLQNGIITPNEWREGEGMNPIDKPEMDVCYIKSATIPLSKAGQTSQGTTTPKGNNPSGN